MSSHQQLVYRAGFLPGYQRALSTCVPSLNRLFIVDVMYFTVVFMAGIAGGDRSVTRRRLDCSRDVQWMGLRAVRAVQLLWDVV